jgi:shikimate kinase
VPPERIFLIGPRGSGKTTMAKLLAARLGWGWLDADAVLEERAGQSIRSIFAAEGEAGFREREAHILAELCRLDRHVVATGGGVVLRPDSRALLAASGWVVWLTADADTLWQRMQEDASTAERRPDLSVGGRDEVVAVLSRREPFYRSCAHATFPTAGQTPEALVEAILAACPHGRRQV